MSSKSSVSRYVYLSFSHSASVLMLLKSPSSDGFFADGPDTYTLYMSVELPGRNTKTVEHAARSPRVALAEYIGQPHDLRKAPDWVYRWSHEAELRAIAPQGYLSNYMFSAALTRLQLATVSSTALIYDVKTDAQVLLYSRLHLRPSFSGQWLLLLVH